MSVPPSGRQFEITASGYRAVATECGAGLRALDHDGHPVVAGYPEDAMAFAGRGQLLLPWPNRVRDGRYTFDGRQHQLPLSEPASGHAIHGLVRWSPWTPELHTASRLALGHRLMAQPGYPWTLDLRATYDLSSTGLHVTVRARNLADSPAPLAVGMHPYLTAGTGHGSTPGGGHGVDEWELRIPAATRLTTDERDIPVGRETVAGTAYDFRAGRVIGDSRLDDTFADLNRDAEGRAVVALRDPRSDRAVSLWMDGAHTFLQVFTGDGLPGARSALAVEPMTGAPDAFRSGDGLLVLAPAGQDGDERSVTWGVA